MHPATLTARNRLRGGIVQADLFVPPQRRKTMKRMGVLLAVALLAVSILSGCVIVPVDGFYGHGYRSYGHPHPYYRR